MPPPLQDGQVTYDDGSPQTVQQYGKDVAAFLMWAAEPKLDLLKARQQLLGKQVRGGLDNRVEKVRLIAHLERLGLVNRRHAHNGEARPGQQYVVRFSNADGSPDLLTQYDFETKPASLWAWAKPAPRKRRPFSG